MKKYRSVCIGDLCVDLIVTGLNSNPTPGREIIGQSFDVVLGGSTSIFCCSLANLGMKCAMVSKVGDDLFGHKAVEFLEEAGADCRYVVYDRNIKSGITLSLSTQKDRSLVSYLGTIEDFSTADFSRKILKETEHIHVASFNLQTKLRPELPALFAEAQSLGVITTLDDGWDDSEKWDGGIFETLRHTDIFFPNEIEACSIARKNTVPEAAEVLSQYCRIVVVKQGKDGAYLRMGDTVLESAPYKPPRIIDTTGAGDSFNAGFMFAYLNGEPIEICMKYGNANGAFSVTHVGGAMECASADRLRKIVESGCFEA